MLQLYSFTRKIKPHQSKNEYKLPLTAGRNIQALSGSDLCFSFSWHALYSLQLFCGGIRVPSGFLCWHMMSCLAGMKVAVSVAIAINTFIATLWHLVWVPCWGLEGKVFCQNLQKRCFFILVLVLAHSCVFFFFGYLAIDFSNRYIASQLLKDN